LRQQQQQQNVPPPAKTRKICALDAISDSHGNGNNNGLVGDANDKIEPGSFTDGTTNRRGNNLHRRTRITTAAVGSIELNGHLDGGIGGIDDDDDSSFVLSDDDVGGTRKSNDDNEMSCENPRDDDGDEEEEEDGDVDEGDSSLFYDSQYDSDSDSENGSEDDGSNEEDGDGILLYHLERIERLQRKLDRRRERLQQLNARKFMSSTAMMVANEDAARPSRVCGYLDVLEEKERRRIDNSRRYSTRVAHQNHGKEESSNYRQDTQSTSDNDSSTAFITIRQQELERASERPKLSTIRWIWGFALFEVSYSVPGMYGIWLSSVTNSAFYGTLSGSIRLLYRLYLFNVMTKTQYSILLVAVGMLLLRLNGTVFDWLQGENYTLARIEMSNRTRLRTVDARLRKFIRRLSFLYSAFNLFGYYVLYAGMVHFNYNIFPELFDSVLYPWLYQTMNLAVLQLEGEMHDVKWSQTDPDWISDGATSRQPPPTTCLVPCEWNVCNVEEVDEQLTSRLGMTPSCDVMMEQVSLFPLKGVLYLLCGDRDSDQDVGWTLYFATAFCITLMLSYWQGYSLLKSCD
jgi:hypothetical protein